MKLGGVRVGSVKAIKEPTGPGQRVTVEIGLKRGTPVYKGTRAMITQNGFVGDIFMLLAVDKTTEGRIMPGGVIPSEESMDFAQIMARLDGLSPGPNEVRVENLTVDVDVVEGETKPLREPTFLITPTIDGRETTYFEWQGSGLYRPGQHRGSMYGGAQAFQVLHFAFDLKSLYLRLDPAESPARSAEVATRVRVVVLAAERQTGIEFPLLPDGRVHKGRCDGEDLGRASFAQVLELELPFAALGLVPGMKLALSVHALRADVEVERLPRYGFLSVIVPDADFEHVHWRV